MTDFVNPLREKRQFGPSVPLLAYYKRIVGKHLANGTIMVYRLPKDGYIKEDPDE